ncbi:MAG: glycosyltransferase, partial [Lutibacter sp.]|nr:glycosyltransferase [Lutibacter sp.]
MSNTLVIIPTYNEKENIEAIIRAVFSQEKQFDILVVDDSSPDGTGDIADEIANKIQNVYVIHRQGKLGIGSAYIAGIEYAVEKIFSDIIFTMDSDLS